MPPSIERQKEALKEAEALESTLAVVYVIIIGVSLIRDNDITGPIILTYALIVYSIIARYLKRAIWPDLFTKE